MHDSDQRTLFHPQVAGARVARKGMPFLVNAGYQNKNAGGGQRRRDQVEPAEELFYFRVLGAVKSELLDGFDQALANHSGQRGGNE